MRTSQILELLMTCFYKGEHSLCNNSIPKRRLLLKSWLMKSMATTSRSVKSFFSCNVRIFKEKMILTLKLWCWYYLCFEEINIEFGFIWELSAENLQTNPKIRWELFWGLFKTQNRNIQLFSPVNQHSKYKKQKKWIQQTLLPPMNSIDIITTLRHSWKNAQTAQTRLCYFSGLLC